MQHPLVRLGGALVAASLLVFVLEGLLYLTAGLLVVAALVGWAMGIAVRDGAPGSGSGRPRGRAAGAIAAGGALLALAIGSLASWGWSLTTGGTLTPIDFVAETLGLLAPLLALVAVAAAVGTARGSGSAGAR